MHCCFHTFVSIAEEIIMIRRLSVSIFIALCSLLLADQLFAAVDAACPTIITRAQWGARPPKQGMNNIQQTPAPFVIIHHSASPPCTNQAICQAKIRSFQDYQMDKKNWSDIGYNFLIGEDGNVYEGRGWDIQGAHTKSHNHDSIGIALIGDYSNRQPSRAAIDATKNLINCGVSQNKIAESYVLLGHKQAAATECPGKELFNLIKTWPHWKKNP